MTRKEQILNGADKTMIEKVCNRLEMRFDEYIVREIRKIMEE